MREIRDDRGTHYVTYRIPNDKVFTSLTVALQQIAAHLSDDHGHLLLRTAAEMAESRCEAHEKPDDLD
jgi:hypothetical protein